VLAELNRQPAHGAVQERVKAHILHEGLKPGDPLPSETQLSQALGVSRTALREAMRGLEATGMIETRHGVGRRVKAFEFGRSPTTWPTRSPSTWARSSTCSTCAVPWSWPSCPPPSPG
jgi:DNA-binding FadR family transcriptional regulator